MRQKFKNARKTKSFVAFLTRSWRIWQRFGKWNGRGKSKEKIFRSWHSPAEVSNWSAIQKAKTIQIMCFGTTSREFGEMEPSCPSSFITKKTASSLSAGEGTKCKNLKFLKSFLFFRLGCCLIIFETVDSRILKYLLFSSILATSSRSKLDKTFKMNSTWITITIRIPWKKNEK